MTALLVGVAVGCMYALVALGYNIIYNATSVFNFAQGDLVALGGLLTYSFLVSHQWAALAAVVPVVVVVGFVGWVQERLSIAPLVKRGEESMAWVITTLGASVVLQNLYQLIWGSQSQPVPDLINGGPLVIWRSPLSYANIIVIITAVICAVGLEVWSRSTLAGRAWLATSEDRDAAIARGINVKQVGAASFIVAGMVSGLAGFVTVPSTSAVFDIGGTLALSGFVAIAIGGFGNQLGALFGGIILGVVQSVSLLFLDPDYRDIVSLILLLGVLLIRPTGLFGYRRERVV
jgi:branched-chain amino acid transport system permease protein